MTTEAHSTGAYIKIFWLLLILTIVEVAIVYMGLPKMLLAVLLVTFAVWKAALVAMHFMHLKFEKKTLTIVALAPFVLCVFLILMLLPDIFAR
ncbi:MAG TPA: cytochrome C oxidase subunit IV family protein [Candidatus Binatus sp.]|nr:cytochrome C oxidase subunit IV family protein [Candidatus Binatus sp.]